MLPSNTVAIEQRLASGCAHSFCTSPISRTSSASVFLFGLLVAFLFRNRSSAPSRCCYIRLPSSARTGHARHWNGRWPAPAWTGIDTIDIIISSSPLYLAAAGRPNVALWTSTSCLGYRMALWVSWQPTSSLQKQTWSDPADGLSYVAVNQLNVLRVVQYTTFLRFK